MQKDQTIYTHRNRQVHIPEHYLAVGQIVGVHGLKGELKVESHTDFPERFAAGSRLYIGSDLQELQIQQSRVHKTHFLIKINGVNNRDKAETYRGLWLFVHEDDAQTLDEDTFWIHDVIGLAVQTAEGRSLGTIKDVLITGANDVYVVKTPHDVNKGKDLLLPAIVDVIQTVNVDDGLMTVALPIGLLEED